MPRAPHWMQCGSPTGVLPAAGTVEAFILRLELDSRAPSKGPLVPPGAPGEGERWHERLCPGSMPGLPARPRLNAGRL